MTGEAGIATDGVKLWVIWLRREFNWGLSISHPASYFLVITPSGLRLADIQFLRVVGCGLWLVIEVGVSMWNIQFGS